MQYPKKLVVARIVVGAVLVGGSGCGAPETVDTAEETAGRDRRAPERTGVVVEEVVPDSALDKAGLEAGDLLLAWRRKAHLFARVDHGEIGSMFDWWWLEAEQGPRGRVKLAVERRGEARTFEIPMGDWGAEVRPLLPEATLKEYSRSRQQLAAGDPEAAMGSWEKILSMVDDSDHGLRCWALMRRGELWSEAGSWDQACASYRSALELARDPASQVALWDALGRCLEEQSSFDEAAASYLSGLEIAEFNWKQSLIVARMHDEVGNIARIRDDLDLATEHFEKALEVREALAPGSLEIAESLHLLGIVARASGDLDLATERFLRSLRIREALVPGSLNVAASLTNLGVVAWGRSELDSAAEYHERALRIRQRIAPEGLEVAASLGNLGLVAAHRGELALAMEHYRRALEIFEERRPDGLAVATTFTAMGRVAFDRGDLASAEESFQRSLKIRARLAPDSLKVADSLINLGTVALVRGDLSLAKTYHERALKIQEQRVPNSLDVAASLFVLGNGEFLREELTSAEEYFRRSLKIREKDNPESRPVAQSLHNLGTVASEQGRLELAKDYFQRSLKIDRELAPEGLNVASSLNSLGDVAHARGELQVAAAHYRDALKIREKLAPNTSSEAETLAALGDLLRHTGSFENAGTYFKRAIDALERQVLRLGGTHHLQGGFRAQYGQYYRNYIGLLLQLDSSEQAFHILERSRARSFLAMLAERDLVFSADVPGELETVRKRIAADFDRAYSELATLNLRNDAERSEALHNELQAIRQKLDQNEAEIRRASPELAQLRHPQPLDLDQVQAILDPGTVLLSYSVGKERSDVFVVSRGEGLAVETLPVGEDWLRTRVTNLRDLILNAPPSEARETAELLYTQLIQPVSDRVEKGERLLFVPDGPLHALPWSALIRKTEEGGEGSSDGWQYLVEWKPLHVVLSATVYAELNKSHDQRHGPGDAFAITLAAFGDPLYPDEVHFDFNRLAASRIEVEGIAELFRGQPTRTYLGSEATEERAKALDSVRYLHFASHGTLDEHVPLRSALVLSIPETFSSDRDNGLLQVWEIFEKVRLDADLVVLSSCESALGQELGGEGLIGLTRAFQYAGARSVLASLWQVADGTTSELMIRFYRHLKAGVTKDAALRAAQLELIRGGPVKIRNRKGAAVSKDVSAPYYWAAFQLYGDWH